MFAGDVVDDRENPLKWRSCALGAEIRHFRYDEINNIYFIIYFNHERLQSIKCRIANVN